MSTSRKRRTAFKGLSLAQAKSWVRAWKRAGARLESLRHHRIEKLTPPDVQAAIRKLDGAYRSARRKRKSRRTSGLVELQAWLRRLGE
jgi:hypothetical protein